jgi:hypothetical protein
MQHYPRAIKTLNGFHLTSATPRFAPIAGYDHPGKSIFAIPQSCNCSVGVQAHGELSAAFRSYR